MRERGNISRGGEEGKKNKYVLGWPKSPYAFFHKINDMFFIFTDNFIDLDILGMSAISCMI